MASATHKDAANPFTRAAYVDTFGCAQRHPVPPSLLPPFSGGPHPPPPPNSPPIIDSLQLFLFTTPQNSFLNKHIARYDKNNEFLDTMQIKMEFKAKN
jgi:hypothetical protein